MKMRFPIAEHPCQVEFEWPPCLPKQAAKNEQIGFGRGLATGERQRNSFSTPFSLNPTA
jgi:hypothetical protein